MYRLNTFALYQLKSVRFIHCDKSKINIEKKYLRSFLCENTGKQTQIPF